MRHRLFSLCLILFIISIIIKGEGVVDWWVSTGLRLLELWVMDYVYILKGGGDIYDLKRLLYVSYISK